MECEHKRIKSENCVISCMECGKILPIDYLVAKDIIAAQNAAEAPGKAVKTDAKKQTRKKVK